MDFTKFNKSNRLFDIDTTGFSFVKAKEKIGKTLVIDGFYKQKNDLNGGVQYIAILAGVKELVNLPSTVNDMFIELEKDSEAIDAVRNGQLALKFTQYHSKTYNKDCVGVTFENAIPF